MYICLNTHLHRDTRLQDITWITYQKYISNNGAQICVCAAKENRLKHACWTSSIFQPYHQWPRRGHRGTVVRLLSSGCPPRTYLGWPGCHLTRNLELSTYIVKYLSSHQSNSPVDRLRRPTTAKWNRRKFTSATSLWEPPSKAQRRKRKLICNHDDTPC